MEDEERQKKVEVGKAKLAQFRQRKAQVDGQNIPRKQKKKKKTNSSKDSELSEDGPDISQSHSDESNTHTTQRGATATTEYTILRTLCTGDTIKHDQTYTIEPESEISTTADDYSSEEEEFGVGESYSEHEMQGTQTRLETLEDELAGKQHEIEELSRELEEMRAIYGTEGLQQLQDFETAIKQRDGIITQLTANLQQARREKDEIMREFLELTEQSQKLKIQFQHLQAGETLRNTSHTSTAADLLHAKQQILTHQQQLEEQLLHIKGYQNQSEEYQHQITDLQEQIQLNQEAEVLRRNDVENQYKKELQERDDIIEGLKISLLKEEKNTLQLKENLLAVNKSLEELKEQIAIKNQETSTLTIELTNSKQKERQSSEEIKQLMGSVEQLQKQYHRGNMAEISIAQRAEMELQRNLEQLRAELDEMYGQQIVQMKQELVSQHALEVSKITARHKEEKKQTMLDHSSNDTLNEEQVHVMNIAINELNVKLQDAHLQRDEVAKELSQKLETVSSENIILQVKIEDLLHELGYAKDQIRKVKEDLADKERKLSEAGKFQDTIEDLKVQIASASMFTKELESKHEAEVTNYKIKLDMLEREKDAVLDRMAESQEAELERLRTQLLFSHEEELCKLREDLEEKHKTHIETLKDNLDGQYKRQLDCVKREWTKKCDSMQCENDILISKQNHLMMEISKLTDLQQSVVHSKSEQMSFQVSTLQKEIETFGKEDQEKDSLEQELQELLVKIELLEKELKDKEECFNGRFTELEKHNKLLKDENVVLKECRKQDSLVNMNEPFTLIGSVLSNGDSIDFQKEIERLTVENEELQKQDIQLKEEIKRQRNTFSFAEKNFEVNYQELQEEYACLVKVKADLELSKIKQEAEYELKLKALNEDLRHLRKDTEDGLEMKNIGHVHPKDYKLVRADTIEGGEVVEKDSTELMEKLELAERDKLDLSVRLSNSTAELNLKHIEIIQLNEEVACLKLEKEQLLIKCKELEVSCHALTEQIVHKEVANPIQEEVNKTVVFIPKVSREFDPIEDEKCSPDNLLTSNISVIPVLDTNKGHQADNHIVSEKQSLLDQLQQLTQKLSNEAVLVVSAQKESFELQRQLDILQSEQADVRLQMEAQRISLMQVHSAHLEVLCENLQAEKEKAICNLRDELATRYEKDMEDLRTQHHLELEDLLGQEAGIKEQFHVQSEPLEEVKNLKLELSEQRTQLEEQHAQRIENLRSYFQQQLKETEERYSTEMIHLQERLLDVGMSDLQFRKLRVSQVNNDSISEDDKTTEHLEPSPKMMESDESQLFNECPRRIPTGPILQLQTLRDSLSTTYLEEVNDLKKQHRDELEKLASDLNQYKLENAALRQEILQLTKRKQESLNGGIKLAYIRSSCDGEDHDSMDVFQLVEKLYQERIAEDVAKVIVEMTIAFAQKTELARISMQQNGDTCNQNKQVNNRWEETDRGSISCNKGAQLCESTAVEMVMEQSFPHLRGTSSNQLLSFNEHEMAHQRETFPNDEDPLLKETLSDYVVPSSAETTKLQLVYEERVEDMRQELVRQEQEHQQAAESLRQAHMLQMERQREDQEQLLEELSYLKAQLSQRMSVVSDNLETEREKMLLHELHVLQQASRAASETPRPELRETSTQAQLAQDEDANGRDADEQEPGDEQGTEKEKSDDAPAGDPSKERQCLQKANNRLLKILLEVVKMTVAVEETIGRHVISLLDKSGKSHPPSKVIVWEPDVEKHETTCAHEGTASEEPVDSCHGSDVGGDDISIWSGGAEEGMGLSQRLFDSGFAGIDIDPENEDLVLNISTRLQAAVEKLLEAINETGNQLEHAKATQTELVRESMKRKQEISELLKSQDELQERLAEEARAREHLASELSKAEGLLDGYSDERLSLEKQMQEKNDLIHRLEQELQSTGNRLQELEEERQQVQDERELLSRQKDAMKADAGPALLQFLEETEKLMTEKIEVQRQAEKEHEDLQKQLKVLESDLEDQVSRYVELEHDRNEDLADLRQKNQALEKQLDKTRKFLDEQAVDREHERDVFQQEIQKLEQQLKVPQRLQPVNDDQTREVERLSNHLKEKTDKCSELLLSKEQLQRDVQERNEEIEKLENRIRELEQALISSDDLHKVEERKPFTILEVKGDLPLEAQLQVEREAIDRKENEITNLEEQLEQFREELENKIEDVQQLHMQLEIQRKESTTCLQELEQENKLLKDQMEHLRIVVSNSEDDESVKDQYLHNVRFNQVLQEKDKEIDHLNEQIAKLQQELENASDNKVTEEKNEQIRELEAQVECLKSDQERVNKNTAEEIEQLNDVIEKLQQELANIEGKTAVDFSGEDADSLKHQLETVIAENKILQQTLEKTNREVTLSKNEIKEAKDTINLLTEQLHTWEREYGTLAHREKDALLNNDDVQMEAAIRKKIEKLEDVLIESTVQDITHQALLTSVEETTQDTINSMHFRLEELLEVVQEKDSELRESYNQIKILKEQTDSEKDVLRLKLLELEENLREKVAAALVSQAQLKAIQVQTKYIQQMETNSTDTELLLNSHQAQNSAGEASADSELSALTLQLLDMNSQLVKMHEQLQFEKQQVNSAQKFATEKEKQLSELQRIMKEMQQNHKAKETTQLLKKGEIAGQETQYTEQSALLSQLNLEVEAIKADAATVKEEMNSYREKTEKLTEELLMKKESFDSLQEDLYHMKQSLAEAEIKLAHYVKLEELQTGQDQKSAGGNQDSAFSVDGSHFTRANSSSQTDKAMSVNNSNQTLAVNQKDAGIQIDLEHVERASSSEKFSEIISQYTEKIGQMQELHAAEILDMEARHISEAESLRREKYVAIQVLTKECDDLRTVIENMSTKQGMPVSGIIHNTIYQSTDASSSEAGSDWSRGTYTVKGFDPKSDSLNAETNDSTGLLPDKIKSLLRAVHQEGIQVLSLSELPNSEKEMQSFMQGSEEWFEERKGFLNTITSLKDLIAKMQVHRDVEMYESSELAEQIPDWRGELLGAIQDVFLKEQDVLVAAFQTQLTALGTNDAAALVNQLQHRLQEQGMEHINAMDCINNADRRSLLLEIQALRTKKSSQQMYETHKPQIEPKSQGLVADSMPKEHIQLLEKSIDLGVINPPSTELQEQLNSERLSVAELKAELAQTRLELESTLKAQHKHFRELETLRAEITEKAAALDALNDTFALEQKKTRELQYSLEKERAKMERIEERGKEELEDLTFSLEDYKLKVLQSNELLEQEKNLVIELQQKIESQEARYEAQLSQERGRNAECQVILEAEKVRTAELSTALEREKELCIRLQTGEGKDHNGSHDAHSTLLKELQSQLEEKHSRIVELVTEMEAQRLDSLQRGQRLEDEGLSCKKALLSEQQANRTAQKKIGELQSRVEELQWMLEEKLQQLQKMQEQDSLLQERLQNLQSKERDGTKLNQNESELENVDSNVTEWDTASERTQSWILQQKEQSTEIKQSGFSTQIEMNGGDVVSGSDMALDSIRHRLQQVSSKVKQLAIKAAKRIQFEAADDEDFAWSQNIIQDVVSQLQRLPEFPSFGEGEMPPQGGSPRSLTERLLKQNAELTGYVSRLTEEKNDLRNILIKLEEELRRYRERSTSKDYTSRHLLDNEVNIDSLIGSEREMWKREKRTLQKSLTQAEAELSKLRAELRNDTLQRDLGGDSENMALKRMYSKYLRSESFRKALIYQKKYLLLLLGGFQECEEATLALIARMGGHPCYTDLEAITHHSRGFTRFRSAVRVSIAISRMKFLVRRWQRAMSSSSITFNRNGFGQSSANEIRTDSPYLPSGGLELYGEQRLSSCRSRSGMESPRSTVNSQHRYQGVPAELGPCSHLQNYDPDRALTDYINRLESLQRRLGNVQSGSTSVHNQVHLGTRR
ncbi:A-kinase anchor protein 9 isoform X2 [Ambystoma mexicanum]|uniref:A-kinase anchor protein 9 isoform X2 n=1 Tax=Ambystoma mexicanum TaxID=8296 RepID=UPI0037E71B06